MGNDVSHAATDEEGEAGNLDSFVDLTEVNTNVMLEYLLENLCVSSSLSFPRGFGLPSKPSPSSAETA